VEQAAALRVAAAAGCVAVAAQPGQQLGLAHRLAGRGDELAGVMGRPALSKMIHFQIFYNRLAKFLLLKSTIIIKEDLNFRKISQLQYKNFNFYDKIFREYDKRSPFPYYNQRKVKY
jgi:hypothetical protein